MLTFIKRMFGFADTVVTQPVDSPSLATARMRTVGPTVAIVNVSTVLTDAQVSAATAALQIQLDRDFAPAWKITATLVAIAKGASVPSNAWIIYLMDTSDQAGALGYHDLTTQGNPIAKVFAKDDQKYGLSWTVTLSHELLEILADPYVQNTVFAQDTNTTGSLYALEVCDACLTGDTLIPLLDGSTARIDELVGREEFYVYSATSDGSIRPGRGHSARMTRKATEIVEVVLDTGDTFKCTPDHLIMLRDGTYKMAGDLVPGQSLMPLYRRRHPISASSNLDYEQVFDGADNTWKFTHRVVEARCPKGQVRHHKDFNRFNNSPTNIELMRWDDHQKLHQESNARVQALPQTRAAARRNLAKFNATTKGTKRPELCVPHDISAEHRQAAGRRGRAHLLAYNGSEEHLNAIRGNQNLKHLWSDPSYRENQIRRIRERGFFKERNGSPEHKELLRKLMNTPEFKKTCSDTAKLNNHQRWHVARAKPSPTCQHCVEDNNIMINHKVVEVRKSGVADVYDITVDQYHNFAVEAGVFVHNCEADQFGYLINGIKVSDFVFPAWFEGFRPANSTRFDQSNVLQAPFQLAHGGYIGVFPVNPSTTGWTQRLADAVPGARLARKGPYSRTNRRGHPLAN